MARRPRQPALLEIVTREGVALSYQIASTGERLLAFLLDGLVLICFLIIFGLALGATESMAVAAVSSMLVWTLMMGWFAAQELFFRGRSLGKRVLHLRVVSEDGGQLRPEALLVRNMLKQMEITVPLVILLTFREQAETVGEAQSGAQAVLAGVLLALNLLPFIDRQRRRTGDLLAGTRVVRVGRVRLPAPPGSVGATPGQTRIAFSGDQLDVYGVYELRTLEDVLRRNRTQRGSAEVREVAEAIRKRIAWEPAPGTSYPAAKEFLDAFYAALVRHMEERARRGLRREHQGDRPAG